MEAVGGEWQALSVPWLRAKGELRCMGLRGAGGLHRKSLGDYYDDMDDDDGDGEESGNMGTPRHSEQMHSRRPSMTGSVEGSPKACFKTKEAGTEHLSPAARLFLAGLNEDMINHDDGEYEEDEDDEDEEDAVERVDALEHGIRNQKELARAGNEKRIRPAETLQYDDNGSQNNNGEDDELVRQLEDELAELVLEPSRTSASGIEHATGGHGRLIHPNWKQNQGLRRPTHKLLRL